MSMSSLIIHISFLIFIVVLEILSFCTKDCAATFSFDANFAPGVVDTRDVTFQQANQSITR